MGGQIWISVIQYELEIWLNYVDHYYDYDVNVSAKAYYKKETAV